MTVRVFQINDCDWWAGDCAAEQILKAYMNECGVTHEQATGDEDILPIELNEEEMRVLEFQMDHDAPIVSFRERLNEMISEGYKFPCVFASTEY